MKKKNLSVGWSVGFGCAFSVLLGLVGALVTAMLLNAETIEENSLKYAVLLVLLISGFFGSFLAQRIAGKSPLPVSAAVGTGYIVALLCCTALFFGGEYNGVWTTALVILGGCGSAVILGIKKASRNNAVHKKYRNR